MKKLFASIFLASMLLAPLSYAGYVAEDIGIDLYSKIDAWASELKMKLIEKRVAEVKITKKLNKELGPACTAKGKPSLCFSDKELSASDLAKITQGDPRVITANLREWVTISTDTASEMSRRASELWGNLQSEVSQEQNRLEKSGMLGIYTDGTLKNSGYDLSVDLENIHAVLFTKDIPYPGKADNIGLDAFASFLNSKTVSGAGIKTPWSSNGGNSGPRVIDNTGTSSGSGGNNGGASLSGPLNSCQSSDIPTLDSSFLSDLASTLTTGSSNGSTATTDDGSSGYTGGGASGNAGNGNGANGSSGGSSGGDVIDSFPCTGFFCIQIGMDTGNGYLLWGGKTYAVESILDKNLKIVDKYRDSSFIASRFTNDFFELSLKNLNLSSLAHIGVIVSSLPAPILNLDPSQTPRGNGPTDAKREFDEIKTGVLKQVGIDPIRENSIDDPYGAYTVNVSAWLSTDELAAKRDTPQIQQDYVSLKEAQIRSRIPDAFSKQLLELSAFSRTFHDYCEALVSLSKKFNEIPQGGK